MINHCTTHHIAVAVDVLGGRRHRQRGAQFQRPLEKRRGKRVVDHEPGARFVSNRGNSGDVRDDQSRIRGRLEPHQPRAREPPRQLLQRVGGVVGSKIALDARHPQPRVSRDAPGGGMIDGNFSVKRLQFNIGEGAWKDTDTVADEVQIRYQLLLSRPQTPAKK